MRRRRRATVHFESLMDIYHLKNAELEANHQKYKGRVVLRGDIVKKNSCGSCAIFTEHVKGVSWSDVTTVSKRKSHRGLDLNLWKNSEEDIWKGWKKSNGTK